MISENARQMLATLQKQSGSQPSMTVEQYRELFNSVEYMRELVTAQDLEEVLASYEDARGRLLTPFEDPGFYEFIERMDRELHEAMELCGIELPSTPVLGSMRTGLINAMTIAVPDESEHLVLFDSGLMTYALLITKAVASAVTFESQEHGVIYSMNPEAVDASRLANASRRFGQLVIAYAVNGTPSGAQPYGLPGPERHLADMLRDTLEMFVLGHEYGHIYLGHGKEAVADPPDFITTLTELGLDRATALSWMDEYAADVVGALLATTAMHSRGLDVPTSYAGCDLFFSALDVMDRAVSILLTGAEGHFEIGSHPPHDSRRRNVRQALAFQLADQPETASRLQSVGDLFVAIVERLFEQIRPALVAAHNDGVRPDPKWRTFEKS